MEEFKKYINEIQKIFQAKNYNEHSFRTPFENLLNALKPKEIKIIHEPKSEKGQGSIRPDFKVYKLVDKEKELSYNHLIGFIECKNLDVDLDKEFKSEQLLRYSQISPNIIFTNYKRFMLLSFEKIIIDINLLDDDLNLIEKNINIFKNLIQVFFDDNSTTIKTKQELVKVLSSQSFYLSNALKSSSSQESDLNSSFNSFFQRTKDTFKSIEKIELKDEEFCDILAQAVVYGIFVSYIENDDYDLEKIPIENFISFLPSTFRTLSEFVYFSVPSFSLPQDIKYTLENIKKTLALIDKVELCNILNQDLESISIYLYEDFLKAFDELRATQKRKEGGVFYTPKSVVKMIVSSLDELLKSKFNKTGFNDKSVKVLDFATGTGSFLAAVFEKIISKESEIFKNETIKNKFLKDIYGFELSFVPYIVARLKLGQILRKSGFKDFSEADFQIYLNNTLDLEKNANFDMFMPLVNLDQEWQKARDVKHDKNLLVILGNPPYNAKSKNKGKEILELLKTYKENLNETNIQPLDDDYIKFMRFAQWKLLEQGQKNIFEANSGLMGFITNNSFLDGRIHRNMRESLYKSFDEIYILNLHGSDKDAKNDENVFDIKIGVCISLFIKYKNEPSKGATIFYASTAQKGIFKRAEKYALLEDISQRGLNSIKWEELSPNEPYFWFVPKIFENEEYEDFWALAGDKALAKSKAVFLNFNSGVETGKDNIAIQPSKSAMEQVLSDFETLSKEAILKKYKLKDLDENIISKTLAEYKHKDTPARITPIAYRPFDTQYTLYSRKQGFLRRTMYGVMQHFLRGENLGLCFPKICLNFIFDYSMVINTIVDRTFGGSKTGSETCIAPLYLYDIEGKTSNFTPEFLAYKEKHQILKDKSPEEILAFIYANLYNPKYRSKYLEYLKIGFPKVSFEVSVKEFERFERLGSELIKLHLMQEIPQDEIDFIFLKESKKPNFKIAKYQEKERFVENKIILNEDLAISPIGAEIWNYTIGGYQVLKQWLKYRKDYVCTKEELEHLLKICKILKKTIEIQGKLSEI
ncbi:type ISP restriction/modification enzyme [Campylobacter upsaliensis]|uniref:type ISP restriction/modification enzyme n=1 Tax=Campylobacter upsaliensis TaxID=28080 RepID=UPI0029120A2A|nr:type ISP restriction/modification enzyme [Campylobacter upsaliensis]ELM7301714.1 N-6 DNA methylase [Campylobacter upsaliensis]MEB2804163.1 type ISP restriction/modification enzyme [Campylobacter upsaliensis]MEB2832445.1 type ISP restriction/modification enzyme [Campylobacter upsaliensis]